jgi:phosphosulfolactate phosphohydrolase-like enzyme
MVKNRPSGWRTFSTSTTVNGASALDRIAPEEFVGSLSNQWKDIAAVTLTATTSAIVIDAPIVFWRYPFGFCNDVP